MKKEDLGASQEQEKNRLKELLSQLYWIALAVALLAVTHDLAPQEFIREQMALGKLHVSGLLLFLNDNFAGDVGNGLAAVFGVTAVAEIANMKIQEESENELLKKISEKLTMLTPFIMTFLFTVAAIDAEGAQKIVQSGFPRKEDLWGAFYGELVGLWSALKFRKAVFPKENKSGN